MVPVVQERARRGGAMTNEEAAKTSGIMALLRIFARGCGGQPTLSDTRRDFPDAQIPLGTAGSCLSSPTPLSPCSSRAACGALMTVDCQGAPIRV